MVRRSRKTIQLHDLESSQASPPRLEYSQGSPVGNGNASNRFQPPFPPSWAVIQPGRLVPRRSSGLSTPAWRINRFAYLAVFLALAAHGQSLEAAHHEFHQTYVRHTGHADRAWQDYMITRFQEALEHDVEADPYLRDNAMRRMAGLYRNRGDYWTALELHQQVVMDAREGERHDSRLVSLRELLSLATPHHHPEEFHAAVNELWDFWAGIDPAVLESQGFRDIERTHFRNLQMIADTITVYTKNMESHAYPAEYNWLLSLAHDAMDELFSMGMNIHPREQDMMLLQLADLEYNLGNMRQAGELYRRLMTSDTFYTRHSFIALKELRTRHRPGTHGYVAGLYEILWSQQKDHGYAWLMSELIEGVFGSQSDALARPLLECLVFYRRPAILRRGTGQQDCHEFLTQANQDELRAMLAIILESSHTVPLVSAARIIEQLLDGLEAPGLELPSIESTKRISEEAVPTQAVSDSHLVPSAGPAPAPASSRPEAPAALVTTASRKESLWLAVIIMPLGLIMVWVVQRRHFRT